MGRLQAAGRKVCGAVVLLCMCFVSVCRKLTGRSPQYRKSIATGNVGTSPATGQEMEWEESWNTMEPFSVTVVPSDHAGDQSEHQDLFQDMKPVLKKTKKVYVGGKESQEKPDKNRFAVDTEFTAVEGSMELGVWEEEGEGGGWEAEMGREEGALMVASREAMAQHRREEREKRRKLQEALRFNQRRQPTAGPLGTRLSDSTS